MYLAKKWLGFLKSLGSFQYWGKEDKYKFAGGKLPCDGFSFLLISTKSKETTRDLKFGCILDGMEDVGLRFGGTGGC